MGILHFDILWMALQAIHCLILLLYPYGKLSRVAKGQMLAKHAMKKARKALHRMGCRLYNRTGTFILATVTIPQLFISCGNSVNLTEKCGAVTSF